MKNKLKILAIMAIGVFLLPNCQKDPDLRMPELQTGVLPKVTKDATKDQTINFTDLGDFAATVKVDLYYPQDKPKSMDLMVCMNNDRANSAVVKAGITSFPVAEDITIAKLVTLLPGLNNASEIEPGDYFKFYVDITLEDGTVLKGNDALYTPYSAAIDNLPGASYEVTYTVVCPLDLNDFVGEYVMDDGYPSDLCVITVSLDPNNPDGLIFDNFYGGTGTGALYPVKVSVNRVTYAISVPSPQKFTDWLWNAAYKDATISSMNGSLDACTGNFAFKAVIDISIGSFGSISFTCTRNVK